MELINWTVDFLLHIDQYLAVWAEQYGIWIYAILFMILFCETAFFFMPFLPGDSVLFVAGTLAAIYSKTINVHYLVIMLIIAAILGNQVNYLIGRYLGDKIFSNPNSKFFKRSYLVKTHVFFKHHGKKTIVLSRFVPIIRTFAPLVAGMGKMNPHFFFASNVLGGIIWVIIFLYLGYLFGTLPVVRNNLQLIIVMIILISVIPAFFEFRKKNN